METPICLKPWNELHIWAYGATFCCWADVYATYAPFQPSQYLWNSKALNDIRNKMLNEGIKAVCPNCPLYVGTLDREIENHKNQFPSDKWDTVGRNNVLSNSSEYPLVSFITVGNKCNSACKMCWLRTNPTAQREMIMEHRIIDRLKHIVGKGEHIEFSGGDLFALTDNQINSFLNVSDTATFTAITNGQGLSFDRMEKYIFSGKIPRLKISMETPRENDYFKHCGRKQGDLLQRLELLNGRNVVWYSTVVTTWTLEGLPDFVSFAAKTNVFNVNIKPYVGTTLEDTGFGFANIFLEGWTPVMHDRALLIFSECERISKRTGVLICGLDLCKQALDKGKERYEQFKQQTERV